MPMECSMQWRIFTDKAGYIVISSQQYVSFRCYTAHLVAEHHRCGSKWWNWWCAICRILLPSWILMISASLQFYFWILALLSDGALLCDMARLISVVHQVRPDVKKIPNIFSFHDSYNELILPISITLLLTVKNLMLHAQTLPALDPCAHLPLDLVMIWKEWHMLCFSYGWGKCLGKEKIMRYHGILLCPCKHYLRMPRHVDAVSCNFFSNGLTSSYVFREHPEHCWLLPSCT